MVHHYRRATITTLARGRYVTALPADGRREHRTLRAARGHIDRWISAHGHLPEPIPEPTESEHGTTR